MSCRDCEERQDDPNSGIAYYRWTNANVAMIGCDKHLREIFDTLSDAQQKKREAEVNNPK